MNHHRIMEKKGIKRRKEEILAIQCKKGRLETKRNTCYIDYISEPPSLESMTLVSIAVRLWTEPDIYEDVKQHSKRHGTEILCTREKEAYDKLEERVIKKLSEVSLPDLLIIKVSNVIRPIGLQLLKCYDYRDREYCKLKDLFEEGCSVHWTADGIIDKRRLLEELITNENQKNNNFCPLFELACKYCLEKNIVTLWEKIPADCRTYPYMHDEYNYHLIAYWIAYIKNELPDLLSNIKKGDCRKMYDCNSSINQNMVTLSIYICNAFALQYFWRKLTDQEKEVNLDNWLNQIIQKYNRILGRYYEYQKYHVFTDILCFLLSQLNDQSEFFRTHSEVILNALFFDWPYQRFFLPTITVMFDHLQEDVYIKTITNIVREIKEERNTAELFRKVWYKSSSTLKNACLPTIVTNTNIILNLLIIDDEETVYLILNSFTAQEKKEIIFNLIKSQEMLKLLKRKKFTLLESLATKTLPSQDDVKLFKESLVQKYGDGLCQDWIISGDFLSVELMLKWSFETADKIENFKKNGINKIPIYTSLICLGDYELIDRFMVWCFRTLKESKDFKRTYIHDSRNDILRHLGEYGAYGWNLFEQFLNYNSFSTEEIADYKKSCLECVAILVDFYNFEFATHLLYWCLGSNKEVKEFKMKLLMSEKGCQMIFFDIMNRKYPNWNNTKNTIKWFSPLTKKSVAYLKDGIDEDDFYEVNCSYSRKNQKLFFFHILDNFTSSYSTSDSDSSSSSDDREFMDILNDAIDDDDDSDNQCSRTDSSTNSDEIIELVADLTDIDINCTDTEDDFSTSDEDLDTVISCV